MTLPTATTLRTIATTALGHERGVFPGDLDQRDQLAAYAIADAILENLEMGGYDHTSPPTETPQEPTQSAETVTHEELRTHPRRIRALEARTNHLHELHAFHVQDHVADVSRLAARIADLDARLNTVESELYDEVRTRIQGVEEKVYSLDPPATRRTPEGWSTHPGSLQSTWRQPNADTDVPYQDDDQRLGGNDNPNPTTPDNE